MSVGNNYREILSKYQNVLYSPTCINDHFYSMCDDNVDIIRVLRDMIDVRDSFKSDSSTCLYIKGLFIIIYCLES